MGRLGDGARLRYGGARDGARPKTWELRQTRGPGGWFGENARAVVEAGARRSSRGRHRSAPDCAVSGPRFRPSVGAIIRLRQGGRDREGCGPDAIGPTAFSLAGCFRRARRVAGGGLCAGGGGGGGATVWGDRGGCGGGRADAQHGRDPDGHRSGGVVGAGSRGNPGGHVAQRVDFFETRRRTLAGGGSGAARFDEHRG